MKITYTANIIVLKKGGELCVYKCTDKGALAAMEEHHIGGEYYDEEYDEEYSKNFCDDCSERIEFFDDRYMYEGRCVCANCLKELLFEEFSADCRIKDGT